MLVAPSAFLSLAVRLFLRGFNAEATASVERNGTKGTKISQRRL